VKTEESYRVGKALGETPEFRLYQCMFPDNSVGVLKIGVSVEQNGLLDREAFLLRKMKDEAEYLEDEYARIKDDPKQSLGYQICFPNLIDSFISDEQGDRRINILKFDQVADDLSRWAPIAHLASRDKIRVDPKTSAWMLGKLLKLLVFTHSQGISIGQLTGENILVERNHHFVAVFDWSKASVHPGKEVPSSVAREEISQVAQEVIRALGGNPETGELPPDDQMTDDSYSSHLYELVHGSESNSKRAHVEFYKLVRSLWPREFWPFTGYRLEK